MEALEKIKNQISKLGIDQVYELEKYISLDFKRKNNELIDNILEDIDSCVHCSSERIILWGNYLAGKRYLCKSCKKTFSKTSGSVLHHIKKKDSFMIYASYMFAEDFTDLKTISKHIGISVNTAIDWRHKILIALGDKTTSFDGFTEMGSVVFRFNQKGRKGLKQSKKFDRKRNNTEDNSKAKLLVSKQRLGVCDIALVKIGSITRQDISRRLQGRFNRSSLIFSNRYKSIREFTQVEKLKHESFKTKGHTQNIECHIQAIDKLAGIMKRTFNFKFRGVSTKYLHNYGTWVSIKSTYSKHEKKLECIMNKCISNRKTWSTFTNIEKLYERFINHYSERTYMAPTKRKWKSQSWNFNIAESGNFI